MPQRLNEFGTTKKIFPCPFKTLQISEITKSKLSENSSQCERITVSNCKSLKGNAFSSVSIEEL